MGNTSLKIALIMTAVNNIAPVLNSARRNLDTFGQTAKKVESDFDKYNKKIKEAEDRMRSFQRVRESGASNVQGGVMMLIPLEEVARQAANFEAAMKKVEIANYDATVPLKIQQEQMKKLRELANKLGMDTVFSNLEATDAELTLIRAGMDYIDVVKGGAAASMYLAQTAEIAPKAAAGAVAKITNMYQLQGDQLMYVADQINRAANASSAEVQNIMQDLQQTGMSAHTLGLNIKDTAMILGVLHNMGLGEGSGNYFNDMLINLDKMTPKARVALQAMGWLEGATVKKLKTGKLQVAGGANSLFDEKGQIKSAQAMINKLRDVLFKNSGIKPQDLRDKQGQLLPQEKIEELMQARNKLKAIQQLKDVFGIQGMRAAIALATPGKGSYEEMVQKAERAKRIQDQVLEWQETLLGKVESLGGSWTTLMAETGNPSLQGLKEIAQLLINATNKAIAFTSTHPQITKWGVEALAGLALGRIAFGGLQFLFGGTGQLITGTGRILMGFGRYAHGFYDTFKYFRQGAGIFRSLWSAVAFGSPYLTKVGLLIGRLAGGLGNGALMVLRFGGRLLWLGAQALIAGGRMAVAWLIGLGPVGWIILGVSAAIALGVAAWKTNFGGFRDWVITWANKVIEVINKVREAMGWKPWDLISEPKLGPVSMYKLRPVPIHTLGPGPVSIYKFRPIPIPRPVDTRKMEMDKQTPFVKMPQNSQDNRRYTFNIDNPDPAAVAKEVAKVTGAPGMDKYTKSRDPRLQSGDFAFAGGY